MRIVIAVATVTTNWRMTIPKHIREMLGLKHHGRVVLDVNPKTKEICIASTERAQSNAAARSSQKPSEAVMLSIHSRPEGCTRRYVPEGNWQCFFRELQVSYLTHSGSVGKFPRK